MLLFVFSISFVFSYGKLFVSLTFDDTLQDHINFAPLLETNGIRGTFYINSGRLTSSKTLFEYGTIGDFLNLQSRGHEIGGHTIDHSDLRLLNETERYYQVCTDLQNLLNYNFDIKSFAFPFSSNYIGSNDLLQTCGYNIGRISNGIQIYPDCTGCPLAITLPITDNLNLRAISHRTKYTTEQLLQNTDASSPVVQSTSYFLLIYVFHRIRENISDIYTITPYNFTDFINTLSIREDISIVTISQIFSQTNYEDLFVKHLKQNRVDFSSSISSLSSTSISSISSSTSTSTLSSTSISSSTFPSTFTTSISSSTFPSTNQTTSINPINPNDNRLSLSEIVSVVIGSCAGIIIIGIIIFIALNRYKRKITSLKKENNNNPQLKYYQSKFNVIYNSNGIHSNENHSNENHSNIIPQSDIEKIIDELRTENIENTEVVIQVSSTDSEELSNKEESTNNKGSTNKEESTNNKESTNNDELEEIII